MARTGLFGGSSQEDGALRLEVRPLVRVFGSSAMLVHGAGRTGGRIDFVMRIGPRVCGLHIGEPWRVLPSVGMLATCNSNARCWMKHSPSAVRCPIGIYCRRHRAPVSRAYRRCGRHGCCCSENGPRYSGGACVEVHRPVWLVHRGCLGRVINGPAGAYIGCMVGSAPRAGADEERPVVCTGPASGTSRTTAQVGLPMRGADGSARFVCDTVRGRCSWVREGGLYGPH